MDLFVSCNLLSAKINAGKVCLYLDSCPGSDPVELCSGGEFPNRVWPLFGSLPLFSEEFIPALKSCYTRHKYKPIATHMFKHSE